MKTYRLALTIGGVTRVEADRYESAGSLIQFYRGDVVHAEFAKAMVKEITEAAATQSIPPCQSCDGGETQ